MAARIAGIGQPMAGDDGVGIAVANYIKAKSRNAEIDVVTLAEPSRLLPLLADGAEPVVVIDAVLDAGDAGRVVVVKPDRKSSNVKLLSTHGVGVRETIALARTIDPEHTAKQIIVVGVTIARTRRKGSTLSPKVEAAVPRAAARALKLCEIGTLGPQRNVRG